MSPLCYWISLPTSSLVSTLPRSRVGSSLNCSSSFPLYVPLCLQAIPHWWGPSLSPDLLPPVPHLSPHSPTGRCLIASQTKVATGFLERNNFFPCPEIGWKLLEDCWKACLHLAFQATNGPICDPALLLTGTHNFPEKP